MLPAVCLLAGSSSDSPAQFHPARMMMHAHLKYIHLYVCHTYVRCWVVIVVVRRCAAQQLLECVLIAHAITCI